MKSCLICDDHEMMREALSGTVAMGWPDAEVTQAADYPSAWAAAARKPDLIISDLVMPGASPVDGVRRLAETAPETPILVVTGNEDDAVLMALLRMGVAGFAIDRVVADNGVSGVSTRLAERPEPLRR